jgi:hypothetical protein
LRGREGILLVLRQEFEERVLNKNFLDQWECNTDKKENQIFLKYKEIQNGAVLLIYG